MWYQLFPIGLHLHEHQVNNITNAQVHFTHITTLWNRLVPFCNSMAQPKQTHLFWGACGSTSEVVFMQYRQIRWGSAILILIHSLFTTELGVMPPGTKPCCLWWWAIVLPLHQLCVLHWHLRLSSGGILRTPGVLPKMSFYKDGISSTLVCWKVQIIMYYSSAIYVSHPRALKCKYVDVKLFLQKQHLQLCSCGGTK